MCLGFRWALGVLLPSVDDAVEVLAHGLDLLGVEHEVVVALEHPQLHLQATAVARVCLLTHCEASWTSSWVSIKG